MKLLFLFFLGCVIYCCASGQTGNTKFRSKGADVGLAFDRNQIGYDVYMLAADLSRSFRQSRKKVFLSWYCQPQVNIVTDASMPANDLDCEFGVNLGIRNYIKINDGFYLFQMAGSGPHFITAEVARQSK